MLRLASRFVARSPFARFVCYDPEIARDSILALVDRGAAFVMVVGDEIVGAIIGSVTVPWFSRDLIAAELGWWVDPDHRGHGNELRRQFEEWAKAMKAEVVVMSDVVLDDATPAGTLYERAGYEMVERSWIKGVQPWRQ